MSNIGYSRNETSENSIHRLTIDQSAAIGSLYDAVLDHLLKTSISNISPVPSTSKDRAKTLSVEFGPVKNKNLSDIVRIDKELCLSIYLEMVDSKGISELIKLPFIIDEYTRYLSYYYATKEIRYPDGNLATIKAKHISKAVNVENATHVITQIKFGIHIVIILQLSPDDESELDQLLNKIRGQLYRNTFRTESGEIDLLKRLTRIHVFSNIADINALTNVSKICQKINEIATSSRRHPPIEYTLQPIRYMYPSLPLTCGKYFPLEQDHMERIELYFYQLVVTKNSLETRINSWSTTFVGKYIQKLFDEIKEEKLKIDQSYNERTVSYRHLIKQICNGNNDQKALAESLIDDHSKALLGDMYDANYRVKGLVEKVQLINELRNHGIEYLNVKELVEEDDHNWEIIKNKILAQNEGKKVFCSDDKLERHDLYTRLLDESKNSSPSKHVYADFTYCTYQPSLVKILSPSSTMNCTNVLLLGESGVGKSTFINALVNYLKFKTLKQARAKKPMVVMPFSFLMTTGDNFDERIITFGDQDSNENHNKVGQSVTQECRSYVFILDSGTKMRLIDTPGMGDTRGLDQDDLNMQHILSFISNLSHLNAICILLKLNEARLNVVLRSYFTRLIGFLGENICKNVIFCFTNTRGTFYAPGNTAPLLKRMLNSNTIKKIAFGKQNTFCFDNEAFRYLVARMNKIKFDDYQKEEYKQSWITSVEESNRLLTYICDEMKPFQQEEWQSVEHARFLINQLVRPLLETLRNTMRNIIICEKISSESLIKLKPIPATGNAHNCSDGKTPKLLGSFWVIDDKCQCDESQYSNIDYLIIYELWDERQKPSLNELKGNLDRLKTAIAQFIHFFKHIECIKKEEDPIVLALVRLIEEETNICTEKGLGILNERLHDRLKRFKKKCEDRWDTSVSNGEQTLSHIYDSIKDLHEDPTISDQLRISKREQEIYLQKHEKQLS